MKVWLAVGITASLLLSAQTTAAQQPPKPNILIIITDDQRIDTLEPFPGATYFPNFFATTPLCCPSRTSIMTGQYSHNHGVTDNVPQNHPVDLGAPTLQGYLDDAGYSTGLFGKFINKWPVEYGPPHFDEWLLLATRTDGAGYYGDTWNDNGAVVTKPGYSTNIAFNRADAFIRRQEGPWYASVAPYAPHFPYTPEEKYADMPVSYWGGNPATREKDRSDKPLLVRESDRTTADGAYIRRQQIRALQTVYDQRDKLLATLEETGQLDNTIILFLSDNGYLWGEHGLTRKVRPYDPSIRVGAYIRGPGFSGGTDNRYSANIDVLPTLLGMANVAFDASIVDGRDMRTSSRTSILTEFLGNIDRYQKWASLRTPEFQYIEWYRDDGTVRFKEYYDMSSDPWQLRNLLHDGRPENNPDKTKLKAMLSQAKACAGTACP